MANEVAGHAQWPIPAAALDRTRLPVRLYLRTNAHGRWEASPTGPATGAVVVENRRLVADATATAGKRLMRSANGQPLAYE